jgi:hypothetical protein
MLKPLAGPFVTRGCPRISKPSVSCVHDGIFSFTNKVKSSAKTENAVVGGRCGEGLNYEYPVSVSDSDPEPVAVVSLY